MAGSFIFAKKPRKKIPLEHSSHPCPKCKHQTSVQLMRSERRWIVLNKCIANNMKVRYECSRCSWRNSELPSSPNDDALLFFDDLMDNQSTRSDYFPYVSHSPYSSRSASISTSAF